MEQFHPCQMPLQWFDQGTGEHRDAVLRACAIAHGDVMVGTIDILHPHAHAFQEAQASPREQTGHQVGHAREPGKDGVHFLAAKNRGEATRAFRAFNLFELGKGLF